MPPDILNMMRSEIKYIIGLLAISVAGMFSVSCIKDNNNTEPTPVPVEDGKVKMEFYAIPDYYSRPTRADESGFDAPMVIVFHGQGDTAVFEEAALSTSTSTVLYTVQLSPTSNKVTLLLVSNISNFSFGTTELPFTVENVTTALSGKTLRDILDSGLLSTPSLGMSKLTTLPFSGTEALPMSAVVELDQIKEEQSVGTANDLIQLKRAVAKVTVKVDPSISSNDFELLSVGVARAAASGSLYYRDDEMPTNVLGTLQYGDGDNGMAAAVNNSTTDNPIYLYESVYERNRTILIAKANVRGNEQYMRMAFYNDGTYLDITRNKHYVFTIIGVGMTYDSFDEAVESNRPGYEGGYDTEIGDNYSYDLINNNNDNKLIGVGYSTIDLFADQLVAFDINVTWYGGDSSSSIDITTSSGISYTTKADYNRMRTITVTVPASVTEGQITFKFGTLIKIVPIVRHDERITGSIFKLPYEDYVYASRSSSWITLSYDGINPTTSFTRDMPGSLYVHAASTTSGTLGYFTGVRQYTGRSLIYVEAP